MVAYSFKQRFAPLIVSGRKSQTVRAERKRHARPGETLQLYTGMRTRSCRLLATAPCCSVAPIRFEFGEGFGLIEVHGRIETAHSVLDFFAHQDGFEDWGDLRRFWDAEHPDLTAFSGVLIQWNPKHMTVARAADA